MMRLIWSQLPLKSTVDAAVHALKRSSNSLVVVGDKAYVYGGEQTPRVPVDNKLWVIGLEDGSVSPAPTSTLRPSARVGACLTYKPETASLYLWGGRESKDMTPCNSDLWTYGLVSGEWQKSAIAAGVSDEDNVEGRSYHAMCIAAHNLYLHAGCPAQGRLATLHSVSLSSSSLSAPPTWSPLFAGPGPGRGGTVLCPITVPGSPEPLLVRYGGFAGHELGGTLDYFSPARRTWGSIALPGSEGSDPGHPLARSVHALVPVSPPVDAPAPGHGHVVAIMLFGERGPAPVHLGHMGAGQFHRDAWALMCTPSAVSAANEHGFLFAELKQEGEGEDGGVPEARGWFAADWAQGIHGGRVVVQGGLNDENNRLGDVWLGKIEV
ncbi:galactose oxidase [Mycena metata]|uniref:Galactose oxidase n=1 Tax=Mycena metata TaxID=1033252 RepID=A0AAD7NE99_9AGAR|nr:galactose oxidase [Mycena metata]